MVLVIEMVIGCALFTIMAVLVNKKNPLSGLHNMPMALQEREAQYQNVKVVYTKECILKKLPALIILVILFVVLIYASGARI